MYLQMMLVLPVYLNVQDGCALAFSLLLWFYFPCQLLRRSGTLFTAIVLQFPTFLLHLNETCVFAADEKFAIVKLRNFVLSSDGALIYCYAVNVGVHQGCS